MALLAQGDGEDGLPQPVLRKPAIHHHLPDLPHLGRSFGNAGLRQTSAHCPLNTMQSRPSAQFRTAVVDDQPAKLLSYEVILGGLGENLIKAGSAREALEHLLKTEIAVILIDVCMPETDGFELAAMIREHPRFENI